MTDCSVYEVVTSRDASSGLGVIKFHGLRYSNPLNPYFFLTVRHVPKASESRVMVVLRELSLRIFDQNPPSSLCSLASKEESYEQLSLYAVGHYLDTSGMTLLTSLEMKTTTIDANHVFQVLYEEHRPQTSDADVFAYVAAKIFWGWRFGLTQIHFSLADHLRLAVPVGDIERVALAGDGIYWTRIAGNVFSPTGKLIHELPSGRFPGLERSPVMQVQVKLSAPRYVATAEHFSKAIDFLNGSSQDLANCAKEATMAVESLAMIVTGRSKGTLGDCIKELRSRGDLPLPLDRVFDALWGYSSEEAGVRHGKPSPPSLLERDATLVVNIAVSAILFLLDLDR